MALLLFSRGSFSGGQLLSECLSKSAGMKCLSREDLIASVNRHGELANKIVATMAKAAQDYSTLSNLRRPYKILMQLALLENVRQGDVAYFGYSGHFLLLGIPHAARVRLIAPPEMRAKVLMSRENLTEEAARERIRREDEERSRWARFMYGKNLRDPEMFDLCINLERVTFGTACCMLVNLVQHNEFKSTPQSLKIIDNRYLSLCVLAALIENPKTLELEIGATAEDGRVTLEGPYLEESDRSVVLDIVKGVPGVVEAQYSEGYAPPFEMMS
jgi:cytidylate kinase